MRSLSALLLALGVAACSEPSPADAPTPVIAGAAQDWRCGDLLLRTTLAEDGQRLLMELPGGRRVLTHTAAASGARYSEPTGTVFWSKGADAAMLELPDGETPQACQPSDVASPWIVAREAGLRARASGNEPGWLLELAPNGELELALDYGTEQRSMTAQTHHEADGSLRVTDATQRMQARFRAETCVDSMSGQRFPMQVTLHIDDRELRGCGRIFESQR